MASRSEIKIVNGQKRRKPNSSSSGSGSPSPPPFDLELAHAAQQVQRHLQQHPDGLVQRRLLNLHPLPGHRNTADATHWRCNACGEAVDATSAHLAWHACRTVGRWKQHHKGWSLHTMQAEGLVVMAATGPLPTATQPPHAATTRSAHQPPQPQQQRPQQHPTCLLCKQALQPLRRHRCASPVLRGYLVDWSAAAGGDALRAGRLTGDHQAAANLARRHPGHVVVMSPPPGAAGGREHLCRCHLLLAPSALGPAAGLGAFAVHLMGRAQADCAATADAVEAAARAAAAAAAGEAVVPLAWNRLGFYVGMVVDHPPEDDGDLAAAVVPCGNSKVTHDPSRAGSALFFLNQAHAPRANVVQTRQKLRGTWTLALAASRLILPGTECVWDYNAISTTPGDVMAATRCLCGRLADPPVQCEHMMVARAW